VFRKSRLLDFTVVGLALWASAGGFGTVALGDGGGPMSQSTDDPSLEWPRYPPAESLWQGPFATQPVCAECHTNTDESVAMRDVQGRPVGQYDLWRSSMMANSFRDPYWHAAVSAEVLDLPELSEAIEAKCLRCHGPMASELAHREGRPPATRHSVLADPGEAQLAQDGVSCTLCHQITEQGLGQAESFSGNFEINGYSEIYGPYYDAYGQNMQVRSQYGPVHGEHLSKSALCATCHTLFTNPVDADGKVLTIEFPEQTPYLEWRNSVYSTEVEAPGPQAADCQDCHMPRTDVDGNDIWTRIAHDHDGQDYGWLPERSPYARHVFVGGNTFLPQIFINHQATLRPDVPVAAFAETLARTRAQLNTVTGRVELMDVVQEGELLKATVSVHNLAGHKFPTGYPSRRAWLYFEVRDTVGDLLFVSGAYNPQGMLTDAQGLVLPCESPGESYQPHYQLIDSDTQVQIYQAIMGSAEGHSTNRLLRATHYLKDNRLLPVGYASEFPDAKHTAPQGLNGDPDFQAGSDRVHFQVPLGVSATVGSVKAILYYQSIGARHLHELFELDSNDIRVFEAMMEGVDKTPEIVAEDSFEFVESG